jgi:putative methyltransferase (TIGR04325 family)
VKHDAHWWAKALTPPIVVIGVKRALRLVGLARRKDEVAPPVVAAHEPEPPEWEFVPEGFARPVRGWDVEAVADAYAEKWPAYAASLEGSGPLAVFHEAPADAAELVTDDPGAQTMLLAFAYVAALASRGGGTLRVLDHGGGLGHYAALARQALPGVALDYTCHELPAVVERGRSLVPDVRFTASDDCFAERYDLVVASSSLQYAEDWRALLAQLASAAESYLYVTRVPVALEAPSFVVLQRAERYGYATEYVGWVLARDELLAAATSAGLEFVREFLLDGLLSAEGAPESPIGHRGFLFRPSRGSADRAE